MGVVLKRIYSKKIKQIVKKKVKIMTKKKLAKTQHKCYEKSPTIFHIEGWSANSFGHSWIGNSEINFLFNTNWQCIWWNN